MKTELRLKLVAAAISMALGSAAAYAQPDTDQAQQRTQDPERSQELSRQQESQQEGEQRQS
ncbi:MAG: hypothetical protein GWO21_15330, partial [Gammaproteobacteria bacterium]|nr:hypothetical protein [Gammaproteobacteria bacterium]